MSTSIWCRRLRSRSSAPCSSSMTTNWSRSRPSRSVCASVTCRNTSAAVWRARPVPPPDPRLVQANWPPRRRPISLPGRTRPPSDGIAFPFDGQGGFFVAPEAVDAVCADVVHHGIDVITHEEEIHVARTDEAIGQKLVFHPAQQTGPELGADQHDGRVWYLACLNEGGDLEKFIQRAEAARQGNVGGAVHHESCLARIEIIELQAVRLIVVVVGFTRQRDVQAHAVPTGFKSALVGGFHDAGPTAGDHGQPGFSQAASEFFGQFVVGSARAQARASELAHTP